MSSSFPILGSYGSFHEWFIFIFIVKSYYFIATKLHSQISYFGRFLLGEEVAQYRTIKCLGNVDGIDGVETYRFARERKWGCTILGILWINWKYSRDEFLLNCSLKTGIAREMELMNKLIGPLFFKVPLTSYSMDFNFKKIASDASGFFSRAKQVISFLLHGEYIFLRIGACIIKFSIIRKLHKPDLSVASCCIILILSIL